MAYPKLTSDQNFSGATYLALRKFNGIDEYINSDSDIWQGWSNYIINLNRSSRYHTKLALLIKERNRNKILLKKRNSVALAILKEYASFLFEEKED